MDLATPPVLIIAFNRPALTRRVLMEVRKAQPSKLFLACDGARTGRPDELLLVKEVHALISLIDWPCRVETRFLNHNMGCGRAVSSAITWFLDKAGEGIILEDDCLPTPAFFSFCSVMLERFRHDARVALISGSNMAPLVELTPPYDFSRVVSCWGWATWKRTWEDYGLSVPEITINEAWTNSVSPRMIKKLNKEISRFGIGDYHTWDYQLLVKCLRIGQLTVIPSSNLILNIGFDGGGTHFGSMSRPWTVPDRAFNPVLDFSTVKEVSPNSKYDSHYLSCSHRGSSRLYRQWLKAQYLVYRWLIKEAGYSFESYKS